MSFDIVVVLRGYRLCGNWRPPATTVNPQQFIDEIAREYEPFGIKISCIEEPEQTLEVRGYGDLLNTVRLRTGDSALGALCLGHVLGQSAGCDLLADLRRGLSRVAFAPETIEPDGVSRRVCHNCGCGC